MAPHTSLTDPRAAGLTHPRAAGLTHPGMVRPHNEDALLVAPELGLYAVADGIGGGAAGEVASHLAVDTIREELAERARAGTADISHLVTAVHRAHTAVRIAGRAERSRSGMGTTLTALLLQGPHAAIAHVGDSRAYRLRKGHLEQLTEDHTLVRTWQKAGLLAPNDTVATQAKSVIVRSVGVEALFAVDALATTVEAVDAFLLASDGLYGVVPADAIARILEEEEDVTRATALLVQAANDGGGPDNVSAVVIKM